MNWPGRRDGDAKNSVNSAGLDNWRESLIIIDAVLLRVTTTYPSSLITCKTPIRIKFMAKNPFARDYIYIGRTRN
jgi:hypothetical protein